MTQLSDLYLVVMAGGTGTRFWPKSTSKKPKQLLYFGGKKTETLLGQTLLRFDNFIPKKHQMIVTTHALEGAVHEQIRDVEILAEPQGRNTAPCIYWAARKIAKENPRGVMLVMPSDHFIFKLSSFKKTVQSACEWARNNSDLITLGIKPSRPETGYGYLKLGKKLSDDCQQVEAFVEKPNLGKAKEFVQSGQYLWNGGMFVWRVDVLLQAFDACMPEMRKAWEGSSENVQLAYPIMTATSIDYGVMEKAKNVVTFALDCGWDDLGSWVSLEGLTEVLHCKHTSGVVTAGEVIAIDSTGNIIDVPGKLICLLGIDNLIIAQHGNSLLIAKKERAQEIKQIVEKVKAQHPALA